MASRALVLLAAGIAVLPKCPLFVLVLLGALGVRHSLHETVFVILQGVIVVGVVVLLVIRRRRSPAQIVFGVAAGGAMLMGVAGLGGPVLGYAGAVLLAVVWLVKLPADAAPSCACATATMTSKD